MRSTNLNATRFLMKRNLFIGVIVFLVVFSVFPFWGLSHIPNMKADIMENALDKPEMLTNLVSSSVMTSPLNLEMMVIVFGGLGFLCAMMLSRHLFSRRQGMLHAALPDKRETDFLRRMIAYALLCLCPIVVNFLLYLMVVAMNGLLSYVAWETLLPRFGLLLLINLYGFAMGMLASVLTAPTGRRCWQARCWSSAWKVWHAYGITLLVATCTPWSIRALTKCCCPIPLLSLYIRVSIVPLSSYGIPVCLPSWLLWG